MPTRPENCPFCNLAADAVLLENESGAAFLDAFPVSNGHTLVIPTNHVASIFDVSESERSALWRLVTRVLSTLTDRFAPDGFNIGVNDGTAAGQTITHAHIHVIPRYLDDVPDPRGGVRRLIPDKAVYWESG